MAFKNLNSIIYYILLIVSSSLAVQHLVIAQNQAGIEENSSSTILTNNTEVPILINTSELHKTDLVENKLETHKITGTTPDFLPVAFLEKGQQVQKAVARVVLPDGKFGTGFLISPSLLITNNHVIGTPDLALKAKFEFNYQKNINNETQNIQTYFASPDFFYSSDKNDLDYTIVKLKNYPGKEFGFIPLLNESGLSELISPDFNPESVSGNKADATILQIIQHPKHRYKEVNLHDCTFASVFEGMKYFRYTCDTEVGSSGSPVFDKHWRLFALHHGHGNSTRDPVTGKLIYLDNEGVSKYSIIEDMMLNNITSKIMKDITDLNDNTL